MFLCSFPLLSSELQGAGLCPAPCLLTLTPIIPTPCPTHGTFQGAGPWDCLSGASPAPPHHCKPRRPWPRRGGRLMSVCRRGHLNSERAGSFSEPWPGPTWLCGLSGFAQTSRLRWRRRGLGSELPQALSSPRDASSGFPHGRTCPSVTLAQGLRGLCPHLHSSLASSLGAFRRSGAHGGPQEVPWSLVPHAVTQTGRARPAMPGCAPQCPCCGSPAAPGARAFAHTPVHMSMRTRLRHSATSARNR